ncbi:Uncharacterized protein TCM_032983 [Theobroma cacao]|uniref:Uncharacterized protein n=1 Tax=Theobroma cacao TaxID=3641 RepID=A0A061FB75_THECC|nr:Uncharacterized protein TCM_032983 [Theobroma cacao]
MVQDSGSEGKSSSWLNFKKGSVQTQAARKGSPKQWPRLTFSNKAYFFFPQRTVGVYKMALRMPQMTLF